MQSNWEEAHSRALREFVEKGMSFAEVANALNQRFGTSYSRNAAIGRARRMGLASTMRPDGMMPPNMPKPPDLRRLLKVRAKSLHANSLDAKDAAAVPASAKRSTSERAAALKLRCVAIAPRHLALVDLEDGDCRYPYGGDVDYEPITFCGHPRREGSSYCVSHFHLTCAPEQREAAPLKAALRLVQAA